MTRRSGLLAAAAGLTLAEGAILASRRGRIFALDTVVRCRRGHLFTTIWVPGGSLKALRLGPWRVQRCPVENHWSLVTPARVAELSPEERAAAASCHDRRIP